MAVTVPADKRLRRAHLKPARKRGAWWRRARAVVLAGIAGLIGYAGYRALAVVEQLEALKVAHVAVSGHHRLSRGEVIGLLDGLQGQSILSIDLEAWRAALLRSPWVADAALRRTLPSTVEVVIVERAPLGIARLKGVLYLVDDRGQIIDEYGPTYADLDLPIIDGLSSVPDLAVTDGFRAQLARRLLEAVRHGNLAARISQIDVSDARNAVVLLEGDPTRIRLGSERFAERLQSYFELVPALREQVPAIDYIDLRFDERVYVGPSTGRTGMRRVTPPARRGRPAQTG